MSFGFVFLSYQSLHAVSLSISLILIRGEERLIHLNIAKLFTEENHQNDTNTSPNFHKLPKTILPSQSNKQSSWPEICSIWKHWSHDLLLSLQYISNAPFVIPWSTRAIGWSTAPEELASQPCCHSYSISQANVPKVVQVGFEINNSVCSLPVLSC